MIYFFLYLLQYVRNNKRSICSQVVSKIYINSKWAYPPGGGHSPSIEQLAVPRSSDCFGVFIRNVTISNLIMTFYIKAAVHFHPNYNLCECDHFSSVSAVCQCPVLADRGYILEGYTLRKNWIYFNYILIIYQEILHCPFHTHTVKI